MMDVNAILLIFQSFKVLLGTVKICNTIHKEYHYNCINKHHVFVIPSYMTNVHVLSKMLNFLASHNSCSRYTIILAMEENEPDSVSKATLLMNHFRNKFQQIIFTVHVQHLNEVPELISNINSSLRTVSINLCNDDIITILKPDVLVPEKYIFELDLIANNSTIYTAPLLYENNADETPKIITIHDYISSANRIHHMHPLLVNIGFPAQIYSMSLALIKEKGYFDTTCDAIVHDVHCFLKAYAITKGNTELKMVPVPINVPHIEGSSYKQCFRNKYIDCLKHYIGMMDFLYVFKTVIPSCGILRGIIILFQLYELYMFPFFHIIALLFFNTYYRYHIVSITCITINILAYEIIRHTSTFKLYNHNCYFGLIHKPLYLVYGFISTICFSLVPFIHVMLLFLQNIDTISNF
jgi:hypothetical protein